MLTVVPDVSVSPPAGGPSSLIDQIVREGARQMLAAARRAEVAAYIDQFAGVRDEDGRRLVVRNGSAEPRTVLTSAGAVEVTAPRVNDKRTDPESGKRMRFSSAILPPWARKTPQAAGLAMAFKLIESAQRRWRMVNAPHLVALVRAGATFVTGKLAERPGEDAPPQAA